METSFHPPLTLVSLLANYPHSHYLPPHWGSHLHTPLFSHSIFWRHGSNVSRAVCCTFLVRLLFWFSTLCRALPSGPAVCAAYPAAGCPLGFSDFSVTGCLTYCCPGGVGWVATLPLFFCASPVPAGLWGSLGPAPCVRVLPLGLCLLFGRQCNSPAWFPLP